MVESTTLNYHWTKPELQKSPSTWGKFLNDDLDAIDGLVFANQQAIVPIGAMTMYGGAIAPTNWLICDGRLISTAAPYDKLFAVLQYVFGGSGAQFALPNLATHFPFGANAGNPLGATGGAGTVTLDATMIPAHTHPVSVTDPKHTHTQTQTPHSHADSGHGHGINDPQHFHTINSQLVGGVNIQPGSGWNQSGPSTTDYKSTGITIQTGTANIQPINANLSAISTVATGITASADANTGGGLAHNNMPPWVAINFIIRYL